MDQEVEWSDGAQSGIGAEQAMKQALGAAEKPDQISREEMRAKILAMSDPADYDDAATFIAKIILQAYEKYPMLLDVPIEPKWLLDPDGRAVGLEEGKLIYLTRDLYDIIKDLYGHDSKEVEILRGSTGFMWGWAVNAARWVLDKPEVPNPALLTIRGS